MQTITQKQYKSLVKAIYESFMQMDENFGLGEMAECEYEAGQIVRNWMKEHNIEVKD